MKFNIHSDKLEITDSIRSYIDEKLGKLNKYFEDANNINARIVVKIKGSDQTIEVTIPTKYFTLRNEERHSDLYAAIDMVVDKLERQIRKNKTKLQNKLLKKKNNDFCFDYIEDIPEIEEKIVRRKKLEMKPMSEEEALLQMSMVGHDFFIYKDADINSVCVIYKRKDGHYGIIETN
jgi:ribosomal subunit interface protein